MRTPWRAGVGGARGGEEAGQRAGARGGVIADDREVIEFLPAKTPPRKRRMRERLGEEELHEFRVLGACARRAQHPDARARRLLIHRQEEAHDIAANGGEVLQDAGRERVTSCWDGERRVDRMALGRMRPPSSAMP